MYVSGNGHTVPLYVLQFLQKNYVCGRKCHFVVSQISVFGQFDFGPSRALLAFYRFAVRTIYKNQNNKWSQK